MLLSKDQVSLFWRLWSSACKTQGWTRDAGLTSADIDAHRKAMLAEMGFSSLTQVDRTAGFGRVKARLMTLCDSLKGAIEADHPEMDDARRKRHMIRHDLAPCLALYVQDPVGYIESILRDKFHIPSNCAVDLEALTILPSGSSPSQLDQAVMTISARLNSLRSTAGDTVHDMRVKSKARCDCASCARHRSGAGVEHAASRPF